MKRALILVALISSVAGAISVSFEQSQVAVSTQTANPTRLFDYDNSATKTMIINNSGFTIGISTSNTGLSTSASTGTFRIPTGTVFTLDGSREFYQGPVWAVVVDSNAVQNVGKFRMH
jgi:hypothetical protein